MKAVVETIFLCNRERSMFCPSERLSNFHLIAERWLELECASSPRLEFPELRPVH